MIVLGIRTALGAGVGRELCCAQFEGAGFLEAPVPSLFHLQPSGKAVDGPTVPTGRGATDVWQPGTAPAGGRVWAVAEELDVEAMIQRFRERAKAVRSRGVPPVEGPERSRFIEQSKADYMDYAMMGDAQGSVEDGILTLRVDLRPKS